MAGGADIYAKHGIPMPPNPNEDAEPMTAEAKLENVQNPDVVNWAQREQEERDRQLRLECLKMVTHGAPSSRMREAETLFNYVKNGPGEPFTMHTILCGVCAAHYTSSDKTHADDWFKDHVRHFHTTMFTSIFGSDG